MKRIIALLLFLICAWGGVSANGSAHGSVNANANTNTNVNKGNGTLTEHTIKHKGIEYTYYLYTPQNLPKGAPLVMVFHGYDGRNLPALSYGFNPVADQKGFAVCYPSGPKDFRGAACWAVGYSFHVENGWERDAVVYTPDFESSVGDLRIGGHKTARNYWHGRIDDLQIFKGILTPSEINKVKNGKQLTL